MVLWLDDLSLILDYYLVSILLTFNSLLVNLGYFTFFYPIIFV